MIILVGRKFAAGALAAKIVGTRGTVPDPACVSATAP
jgi:hypothetical protein